MYNVTYPDERHLLVRAKSLKDLEKTFPGAEITPFDNIELVEANKVCNVLICASLACVVGLVFFTIGLVIIFEN